MRCTAWILCGIAALAGCASAPRINYHTLDMRPAAQRPQPVPVEIGRIEVAEPLAGHHIMVQAGPTRVEYYAVDQWAAGIDTLLREKLAAEFQFQGGAALNPARLRADGLVQSFGQEDNAEGANAHLKVAVEYRLPDTARYREPLLIREYDFRQPAQPNHATALAEALSKCVEALATAMSEDAQKIIEQQGKAAP